MATATFSRSGFHGQAGESIYGFIMGYLTKCTIMDCIFRLDQTSDAFYFLMVPCDTTPFLLIKEKGAMIRLRMNSTYECVREFQPGLFFDSQKNTPSLGVSCHYFFVTSPKSMNGVAPPVTLGKRPSHFSNAFSWTSICFN